MHAHRIIGALLVMLLGGAAPAVAQSDAERPPVKPAAATPAAVPAPVAAPAAEAELELVFEREVFMYPVRAGRDPFKPLLTSEFGPRFEDLTLRGVIFSEEPGHSVVLLADTDGKIYRVRRGEMVGNARVINIQPLRVLFAVNNFGIVRQEMLELKRNEPEGVKG